MESEKLVEIRQWMQKASLDLRAAQVDLAAKPPLTEDAMFHCQQAAEKAMKAFLTNHDRPFRKTHDLNEIAQACEAIDPSLAQALQSAKTLTAFASRLRYPDGPNSPDIEEAKEGLTIARRAYDSILALLPADARP